MNKDIPEFLQEILIKSYGEEIKNKIIEGYKAKRLTTVRINTLKTNTNEVRTEFHSKGIRFKEVSWSREALIIEGSGEDEIRKLKMYENGEIYLQSLSSMIPPIVLDPKANENILDMAAAPGGKTTQMAALSKNEAMITACEKNKIRLERLKYNIEKQGARVNIMLQDARRLDNFFAFDKILLDAPCSGSGTENVYKEEFTKDLIKRSIKFQDELIQKAIQILKPGGEIIYSTCSILKEENEEVVKKVLARKDMELLPIDKKFFDKVTLLPVTIDGTICIAPSEFYEGFFIAKIRKNK